MSPSVSVRVDAISSDSARRRGARVVERRVESRVDKIDAFTVKEKPIAVGMRTGSWQPASPDTRRSIRIPRFVSSLAMPWKSAGVGAGAVVEIEPHALTRAEVRSIAARARDRL